MINQHGALVPRFLGRKVVSDWPGIGTGFVNIVKDWAQCQLVCQSMTAEFALVRPPSRLGTKPHRGLVPSLSAGMAS